MMIHLYQKTLARTSVYETPTWDLARDQGIAILVTQPYGTPSVTIKGLSFEYRWLRHQLSQPDACMESHCMDTHCMEAYCIEPTV